jgi:hypothetical protein
MLNWDPSQDVHVTWDEGTVWKWGYGCMLNWDPSQDVLGIKVQFGSGAMGVC